MTSYVSAVVNSLFVHLTVQRFAAMALKPTYRVVIFNAFAISAVMMSVALATAQTARADYTVNIAAVQCDSAKNRVLITFGTVTDENPAIGKILTAKNDFDFTLAPIPTSLSAAWSKVPFNNGGDCKFDNGQTVLVSIHDGPVLEDEGGADPNSSFKMIINHRVIYDNLEFYRGHGSGYDLSAIEYDGKSLEECNPQEPDGESESSNPICYDASKRLLPGNKYFTKVEQDAWEQDQLKASLIADESPFCRHLANLISENPTPNGLFLSESQVIIGNNNLGQESYSESGLDIYNNGKTEEVVYVGVDSTRPMSDYTGGWGFLMLFDDRQKADEFIDFIRKKYDFDFQETQLKNFKTLGSRDIASFDGTFINASSAWPPLANINNIPITYEGKTYILSTDDDVLNMPIVPSGLVSEVWPDHSIKTVCELP